MQVVNNSRNLGDYVESLYAANSFAEAFQALQNEAISLGFDGALYTYIPKVLINSNFNTAPVFEVSDEFNPKYLQHYTEARFDKHDPLIKAVEDGVNEPIKWHGDICNAYANENASREVMLTSRQYGINNGLTLPMMSGSQGIAGASFISGETRYFDKLLSVASADLSLRTLLFHKLVASNALYLSTFTRPLFESLSKTEISFLAGLAEGKSPGQLAYELNKSAKYLEQVMLNVRRKFSGVGPDEQPSINRNQLLYYAGLMNILGRSG